MLRNGKPVTAGEIKDRQRPGEECQHQQPHVADADPEYQGERGKYLEHTEYVDEPGGGEERQRRPE
jgi:hypothetical protein